MRKLAAVLILFVPILLPQEGFSEVARFVCPTEAKAKIVWVDKIGEDPTLTRQSPPDEWVTFGFKIMQQEFEQRIVCKYVFTNGTASVYKDYAYTAKRKIGTCTKVSARVLDCPLE